MGSEFLLKEGSGSALSWPLVFVDQGELMSGLNTGLSLFCSDTNTVVGLPRPIHESIKTLKQVGGLG